MSHRTKTTPPKLAARYGVSEDKVLYWIHSGELAAIDAATRRGGRPRYLIDEADVRDFEARRAVQTQPKSDRARTVSTQETEEFF